MADQGKDKRTGFLLFQILMMRKVLSSVEVDEILREAVGAPVSEKAKKEVIKVLNYDLAKVRLRILRLRDENTGVQHCVLINTEGKDLVSLDLARHSFPDPVYFNAFSRLLSRLLETEGNDGFLDNPVLQSVQKELADKTTMGPARFQELLRDLIREGWLYPVEVSDVDDEPFRAEVNAAMQQEVNDVQAVRQGGRPKGSWTANVEELASGFAYPSDTTVLTLGLRAQAELRAVVRESPSCNTCSACKQRALRFVDDESGGFIHAHCAVARSGALSAAAAAAGGAAMLDDDDDDDDDDDEAPPAAAAAGGSVDGEAETDEVVEPVKAKVEKGVGKQRGRSAAKRRRR